MKIRNGFVSNSSSSSFLVWFQEIPEDAHALRKMLFGDMKELEVYDDPFPTDVLAEQIWMDMQKQLDDIPYDVERIRKELYANAYWEVSKHNCGTSRDPSNHKFRSEEYDKAQEAQYAEVNKEIDKMMEAYQKYPGTLFIFEYSDNDGDMQTTLEHGDVFERLTHIQVNRH